VRRLIVLWGLLSGVAQAEELMLADEAERVSVTITGWGPSGRRSIVQWKGVPGADDGVAIFERSGDEGQSRLTVVGGGASFWLRSGPSAALVKGTSLPTWELVLDRRPPITLVSRPGDVPRQLLERAYREAHGLPLDAQPKERVTASLEAARKKVSSACGAAPAVRVDWPAFGRAALPVVAAQVLAALEALCGDADYRAAIAELRELIVTPTATTDFELERATGSVIVRLRDDVANPRERALQSLRDTL
jgi:hypothetical protein